MIKKKSWFGHAGRTGDRGKYMSWRHIKKQRNGLVTKLSWWTEEALQAFTLAY